MKMKIKYCPLLLLALLAPSLFAQPMNSGMAPPPSTNAPPPDKTKLNQMIGSSFGRNLANADIKDLLDYDAILKAMKDQVDGKPEMTEAELKEVSREFSAYMRAKQQIKALEVKKAGEDFLKANAVADGVKTLPDGLQYKIIKTGTGDHPKSNDVVNVKYTGTL